MILLVFLSFGLILLVSGKDPIQSYMDIFTSTFGSAYGFSEVIVAMIPMLITALAVALPWRVGLINIGGLSTFAALDALEADADSPGSANGSTLP
jgi:simple sugar transport system permease protein